MTVVGDVLARLAARTGPGKAAAWDVAGLQLGDPAAPVSRVGVCHEVTEAVVAAAVGQVDLLVTYHPLLFHPVRTVRAGWGPEGRAFRLVRAGVSLAVAHTGFDTAAGGTADALARALGLTEVQGFAPLEPTATVKVVTFVPEEAVEAVADAMAGAGAGVIGNYTACSFRSPGTGAFLPGEQTSPWSGARGEPSREPEVRLEMIAPRTREAAVVASLVAAHPYEEPAYDVVDTRSNLGFVGRIGRAPEGTTLSRLADAVAAALGPGGLRVSGDPAAAVDRVAVVPGAGSSLVATAAAAGAEALVTGDVAHHDAVAALDRGMSVVDPGHAATERPGMDALVEVVRETAGDVDLVDLTGLDPAPWR